MKLEEQLQELDRIVKQIEDGSVSLEGGIELFEQGLKITKDCLKRLNDGKEKIRLIKQDMDQLFEETQSE